MTRRTLLSLMAARNLFGKPPAPLVVILAPAPRNPPRRYRLRALPVTGEVSFPPQGVAYREDKQSHRIWRIIHALAPSLVVDPAGLPGLAAALDGRVPVTAALPQSAPPASPLALTRAAQIARSPRQLAEQFGQHYGHTLTDVTYIQALSCMARMTLGALPDIEQFAAPYIDGRRDSLAKPDSTLLAGHLLFADLYQRTGNRHYLSRVLAAANLGFSPDGTLKESMPFHNEMSDSVFMGCPILGQAARLTGETRYHTMAIRHLRFMQALCLRPDGLYRHSPLCDAAWGRGNAFPALGMALLLETMPDPDPHALDSFRRHMRALAPHQDPDGLWHQVIDQPDS